MGNISTFTKTATIPPMAIEYSLSMEVIIGFPMRYPETMIKQYVKRMTRKPYSYGAKDGHNFMNEVTVPVNMFEKVQLCFTCIAICISDRV